MGRFGSSFRNLCFVGFGIVQDIALWLYVDESVEDGHRNKTSNFLQIFVIAPFAFSFNYTVFLRTFPYSDVVGRTSESLGEGEGVGATC